MEHRVLYEKDRDKDRRKRKREKGKRWQYICPRGTLDYLWIHRRKIWHIGKWKLIKERGETLDRMRCLILIGHVN